MRLFLSIKAVETLASRGLKKLGLSLPREKSGLGTSSSLNREGVGRGEEGHSGEGSPERGTHASRAPANCSCPVNAGQGRCLWPAPLVLPSLQSLLNCWEEYGSHAAPMPTAQPCVWICDVFSLSLNSLAPPSLLVPSLLCPHLEEGHQHSQTPKPSIGAAAWTPPSLALLST